MKSTSLYYLDKKYSLDTDSKETLQNLRLDEKILEKVNTLNSQVKAIKTKEDCISCIDNLSHLLYSVCSLGGIRQSKENYHHRKNKPWFDSECKMKKQELNLLGKQVVTEHKNSDLRFVLFVKKKEFKDLINYKKSAHNQNLISEMKMSNSNPKQFWKLLNKLKKDQTDETNFKKILKNIGRDSWIKMFSKLLHDPNMTNMIMPDKNESASNPLLIEF